MCQLGALSFAPLIVVQPLGAIALVITTLLNAQISGHKPTKRSLIAIAACVGGIFVFVTIAALYATDAPVSNRQLITILILLGVVTIVFGGSVDLAAQAHRRALLHHRRRRDLRVRRDAREGRHHSHPERRLRVADASPAWQPSSSAPIVGAYFVQTAYSSGPPDLVIAGLTVVDPMVAILIGLIVLNEAAGAPLWVYIAFGVVGAIAVWGVFQLARYHPQILSDSQGLPIERGSNGGADAAHPDYRLDQGDRGGVEGVAGPAGQRQGRRTAALIVSARRRRR